MIDSRDDRSQNDDLSRDEDLIDDLDPLRDPTNPTPTDTATPTPLTPTPLIPPAPFNTMVNQLQVCNWLVQNPDYLKLANEMLAAANMDIDSSRISVKSIGSAEVDDSNVSIIL